MINLGRMLGKSAAKGGLGLLLVTGIVTAGRANQPVPATQPAHVRAKVVLAVARFVAWPAYSVTDPDMPLRICVLDEPSLAGARNRE